MSKASEWASETYNRVPVFRMPHTKQVVALVCVDFTGFPALDLKPAHFLDVSLSSDTAQAFARWILATFGEDEAEKGGKK